MNYELRISNYRRILIILTVFIFLISKAFAAELSFETKGQISVGRDFELNLFLNTEKENINAIEGKISYPSSLEIKEIRDGGSIIALWIKKPQSEDGKIIFAGIIPGGIVAEKGKIFSIIFKAKNSNNGTVSIFNARTLLNDGRGTPTKLKINNYKLKILEQSAISQISFISEDKDPPGPFQLKISSDPNVFDGKKFLVFVAQDKQSGIDHYEIKEGWFGSWLKGESPYLLKNQELSSYIYVRAVDKVGNAQIAILPAMAGAWYVNYWLWIIIIICCALVFIYFFYRSRRWR